MNLKNMLAGVVLVAGISTTACKSKPNDAELKTNVETAIANPDVMVAVNDADVTLTGSVADDAAKNAAESSAKGVEGVKAVNNDVSVMPPPPPPPPVVIESDSALQAGLARVEKLFNNVKATAESGVVTLTGTVDRDALPRVMQAVMALRPKSVDNKLTIK